MIFAIAFTGGLCLGIGTWLWLRGRGTRRYIIGRYEISTYVKDKDDWSRCRPHPVRDRARYNLESR